VSGLAPPRRSSHPAARVCAGHRRWTLNGRRQASDEESRWRNVITDDDVGAAPNAPDREPATPAFARLGLGPGVMQAIARLGYEAPTAVQERAIPILLEGRDLVAQAPTGTGKTAAYGLPIVERLAERDHWPQALVVVPTRELAIQVADALGDLGRSRRLVAFPVYRSLGERPACRDANHVRGACRSSSIPARFPRQPRACRPGGRHWRPMSSRCTPPGTHSWPSGGLGTRVCGSASPCWLAWRLYTVRGLSHGGQAEAPSIPRHS
jgi:DEAD/DEAH box helicase